MSLMLMKEMCLDIITLKFLIQKLNTFTRREKLKNQFIMTTSLKRRFRYQSKNTLKYPKRLLLKREYLIILKDQFPLKK